MSLSIDTVSGACELREGGLGHLIGAVEALECDLTQVDNVISMLMETLRVSSRPEPNRAGAENEAESRSVIEYLTRYVIQLQQHSARQQQLLAYIGDQIS